ncbi:hypothetical protein BGW80DRAFT_1496306 [Lactifluus volemus]|nr:hypothetical protein BGW80DRAFT_1496306 [Lactifluus volemus]
MTTISSRLSGFEGIKDNLAMDTFLHASDSFNHQWFQRFGRSTRISEFIYTPPGALKFSASLRVKYVSSFRTLTVLAALATHPFILFLTLPRILRQAVPGRRQLNVYKRLEPNPVSWSTSPSHSLALAKARRAHALGVCIKIQPGDPSAHVQRFGAGTDGADSKLRELAISSYTPPFADGAALGSVRRSVTRKRGRRILVSDETLFHEVFGVRESGGDTWLTRMLRVLPDVARGHEQGVGCGWLGYDGDLKLECIWFFVIGKACHDLVYGGGKPARRVASENLNVPSR